MPTPTEQDQRFLTEVFALAQRSRDAGHHPFAALVVAADGRVIAEAMNASSSDRTAHAEMNALRAASSQYSPRELAGATLYSSAEPCAMCAGGAYWSGVGRVVYGMAEATLLALTGSDPENPTLSLPCRQVFAAGQRPTEVIGPLREDEAKIAHQGFWHNGDA
ncbi:tRNA(Arg) A34 adenosine deaminase TadA [Pseudoduganella flava]|uniref:Nucleoside deaminase n=1 Tax=Pseudoduganella flava TaxID=871742 RepID=A0A562PGP8_9BURK|nr:nucleoside deaminase [Pseudoduganella flava]QGZ40323.1 nucleoside deaminase [Pseudoduganella flava]TWI43513.1 tRNA(Arg) A34 adenosine deaminase TadA [Pseudoduganella flava]